MKGNGGQETQSAATMALLTIIRRLQLCRQHQTITFHVSPLVGNLFLPGISRVPVSFYREFHRTSYVLSKPTPQLGHADPPHPYGRSSAQIINFLDDMRNENTQQCDSGVLEKIQKAREFDSGEEAITFLDDSGVKPDKGLIFSLIWTLREEWKLAFLVYKWGEKWDCVVEKSWCLMIWLLCNHNKYSTAWSLIHELYNDSKDTQQAMLIMIDRYAAANHPDNAIRAFNLLQKFKFSPDLKTYFALLEIMCIHGNVEEAEDFMYVNKKFFPLETESFNIILNGWCNIAIDIYEAKRVWREMSKCCIEPDGTSYTHMISCYSRVGNLFESLRLYDEMKKRGWVPELEVYHSLIYVLTRDNCLLEALKIVDRMRETGFKPNITTYNLIITPLCEASKFEDARSMVTRMLGDGIDPTRDTYHALLEGESLEGTLGVLNHMRRVNMVPSADTYSLVLDKFFRTGQPQNALDIWSEMKRKDIELDEVHYRIMVEGLVQRGLSAKALEFYSEMKSVTRVDDPSLKKLLLQDGSPQETSARKGEEQQITVVQRVKNKTSKAKRKRNNRGGS